MNSLQNFANIHNLSQDLIISTIHLLYLSNKRVFYIFFNSFLILLKTFKIFINFLKSLFIVSYFVFQYVQANNDSGVLLVWLVVENIIGLLLDSINVQFLVLVKLSALFNVIVISYLIKLLELEKGAKQIQSIADVLADSVIFHSGVQQIVG